MNYSLLKEKTTLNILPKDSIMKKIGKFLLFLKIVNNCRTPYVPKAKYMYNATSKNVKPYMDIWFANYMHGYDNFNI